MEIMVNSNDESGAATNFKNEKIIMSMKMYCLITQIFQLFIITVF